MTQEEHYLSLKELKELIETGKIPNEELKCDLPKFIHKEICTTLDIISLLPESPEPLQWFYCDIFLSVISNKICYNLGYATRRDDPDLCHMGCYDSLICGLYETLCWCIENKYLNN